MSEHRHAYILKDIADGTSVQYMAPLASEWADIRGSELKYINPISHEHYRWRRKPEPTNLWEGDLYVYPDGYAVMAHPTAPTSGARCIHAREVTPPREFTREWAERIARGNGRDTGNPDSWTIDAILEAVREAQR